MPKDECRVAIASVADIVAARQTGRSLAVEMGFDGSDVTLIAAAISEVSRNIIEYAGTGEIVFRSAQKGARHGLCVIARDQGPGIPDIARAMEYGYSTGRGMGVGLPGAKRLMDEFDIQSKTGAGTVITMSKWLHGNAKRYRFGARNH
jgi:serine/threonine-protein kinase RsbT